MIVPINRAGEKNVLGVVRVVRSLGSPKFSKSDENTLEGIAESLALSLVERARQREIVVKLTSFGTARSKHELNQAIVEAARTLIPAHNIHCSLFLADPAHDESVRLVHTTRDDLSRDKAIVKGRGIAAAALGERKPLLVSSIQSIRSSSNDPLREYFQEARADPKTESFVAVPFFPDPGDSTGSNASNHPLGVLTLTSPLQNAFFHRDLETLTELARQTASLLVQKEREQLAQDTFKALLDANDNAIISIDGAGKVLEMNEAAGDALGIKPAKARGQSIVGVAYGGQGKLARHVADALQSRGGVLGDHYAVLYRAPDPARGDPAGTREHVPIPVRINARSVGGPSRQRRRASIGVFEPMCTLKDVGEMFHIGGEDRGGWTAHRPFIESLNRAERATRAPDPTFLVVGESGSGKELVARHLHRVSEREILVDVTINAIPPTLIGSMLFGVERGVSTDVQAAPGYFRMAHRGVLLLDEVAEIPLAYQGMLLRVLQERRVLPIGGKGQSERVDVLLIACTNDLAKLNDPCKFRTDLLARFKRQVIEVPPLRARRGDIMLLAERLVTRFRKSEVGELRTPRSAMSDAGALGLTIDGKDSALFKDASGEGTRRRLYIQGRSIGAGSVTKDEPKRVILAEKLPFPVEPDTTVSVGYDDDAPFGFGSEAVSALLGYSWPLNVRELEHAVEESLHNFRLRQRDTKLIEYDHLPRWLEGAHPPAARRELRNRARLAKIEREVARLAGPVGSTSRDLDERLSRLEQRIVSLEASIAKLAAPASRVLTLKDAKQFLTANLAHPIVLEEKPMSLGELLNTDQTDNAIAVAIAETFPADLDVDRHRISCLAQCTSCASRKTARRIRA